MTQTDRLERDLTAWFVETAAPRTPDFLDDILAQTAGANQRAAWTFPERWLPMSVITLGRRTLKPVPWRTVGLIAVLTLLIAAALAVYVGSQRSLPTPFGPAANGVVAYVEAGSRTPEQGAFEAFGTLMTVDPVSGQKKPLLGGKSLDGQPVYSLDGSRLAFVRKVNGGVMLHAVGSGGGDALALSGILPNVRGAAWSPDGGSIAFTTDDGTRSSLWIASADGSGVRMIPTDVSVAQPQWRPADGREILVVGSPNGGFGPAGEYQGIFNDGTGTAMALYLVRPDGSDVRRITPADGIDYDYSQVRWTPDGTRIVTNRGEPATFEHQRMVVLAEDGREVFAFAPDTDPRFVNSMAAIVSPDGTKVAYAALDDQGLWQARVRALDGTGPVVKTGPEFEGAAATLRWSPDGKELIVNHHWYGETWLLDPGGGSERRATWTDPGYVAYQRVAR